jgi:hypothetical protein
MERTKPGPRRLAQDFAARLSRDAQHSSESNTKLMNGLVMATRERNVMCDKLAAIDDHPRVYDVSTHAFRK